MKTLFTEVRPGGSLKAPFDLVHVTDTHFTYGDERDGEKKIKHAKGRSEAFGGQQEIWIAYAEATARALNAPIVHTGDLIDFVSQANLDRAKRFFDENDVALVTAGNHEFAIYIGDGEKENAECRNRSLATVQSYFPNDIRFYAREMGGVKLIGMDDGYYLFEEWQLERLKQEAADGMPILLFLHNPIYTPELHEALTHGNPTCSYLVGVPEELTRRYPPDRMEQQTPDAVTLETVDYIKSCPQIRAVFAGHLHCDAETMLTETLPQYITSMTTARVIQVR